MNWEFFSEPLQTTSFDQKLNYIFQTDNNIMRWPTPVFQRIIKLKIGTYLKNSEALFLWKNRPIKVNIERMRKELSIFYKLWFNFSLFNPALTDKDPLEGGESLHKRFKAPLQWYKVPKSSSLERTFNFFYSLLLYTLVRRWK